MRLTTTILTICAAATFLNSATAQQKMQYDSYAADQKKIEALSEQWRSAVEGGQVAVMQEVMAEDAVMVGPDGKSLTPGEELARHQSGELKIKSATYSDIKVKVYIGVAIVSGQSALTGTFKDKDIKGDYRFIEVYEVRKNAWKAVYRQLTHVKTDEQKPAVAVPEPE